MFRKTLPAHRPCAIVLLAMAAALAASAQEVRAAPVRLPADLVKTGLYIIHRGVSNSLLRLSANGLVVVNANTAADYDALMRQIHRISDQPVRVLIDTDYREEHTRNNGRFIQAGTGILAHENVKTKLAGYSPTGGKITLPTKTFDREFTVRGGGIEVQTLHFGNARTNGDTVVYFADRKVVAVGDLLAAAPDPDYSAGGSLLGWAGAGPGSETGFRHGSAWSRPHG
jgi:cyclase